MSEFKRLERVVAARQQEETAAPFSTGARSGFGDPVHAICQEFGSNRQIRVTADLERKIVTPLLRNPT